MNKKIIYVIVLGFSGFSKGLFQSGTTPDSWVKVKVWLKMFYPPITKFFLKS